MFRLFAASREIDYVTVTDSVVSVGAMDAAQAKEAITKIVTAAVAAVAVRTVISGVCACVAHSVNGANGMCTVFHLVVVGAGIFGSMSFTSPPMVSFVYFHIHCVAVVAVVIKTAGCANII